MPTSFIPKDYTGAEAQLAELTEQVSSLNQKAMTTIATIATARDALAALSQSHPIGYLSLVQYIRQQAAAAPNDAAWQALDARADKIVADYQVTQTYLDNVVTAIEAV